MQADEYLDPEVETMSPEQLRALQDVKLGEQLDYLFIEQRQERLCHSQNAVGAADRHECLSPCDS